MRLVVIGGGAAGFFCAVNAARLSASLEVIVVEKSNKLLSKVKVSGGGRCNVTHACFSISEIIKKYPRGTNFVKKTFYHFFTEDTIAWFKERGVLLKIEADGRMFPVTDSSETIINCLLHEADKYKVKVWTSHAVKRIEKARPDNYMLKGEALPQEGDVKEFRPDNDFRAKENIAQREGQITKDPVPQRDWKITFENGEEIAADFICIAAGGYPKASMFDWILSLGHSIESPVPSLFTFNMPGHPINELMGISTQGRIKIQGTKLEEEGPVLITHWGLSGPAVLKLSARGAREFFAVNYRFIAMINWCPEFNEHTMKEQLMEFRSANAGKKVMSKNELNIPHRLWEFLCRISGIDENTRWAEFTSVSQNKLIKNVCSHELRIEGKTTFKEEFVTAGGIKLTEIDPTTMESRLTRGLYFAGEILDVDGVTGGFNFQHAWTSGWIAASAIAAEMQMRTS